MKTVRIHQYGGPEVLQYEQIPVPAIRDNEVLVKIYAAGVNPVDWKIRAGYFKEMTDPLLSLTLGWDLSGEVVEIGKNVTTFAIGDAVFAMRDLRSQGAYAEFIAIPAIELVKKPTRLDHIQAASVPLAALTAWQALFDLAELTAGQRVLIHAAAGGVGHFAVQLAKWKGATVIATASAKNRQFLLDLGADQFIDYQAESFEKQVNNVDVVFDLVGGETQKRSWSVLKKGGILITSVDPSHMEQPAQQFGVRAKFVLVAPSAYALKQIAVLIEQKQLTPHIFRTFSLSDAAQAHQLSESGQVRGKIALVTA